MKSTKDLFFTAVFLIVLIASSPLAFAYSLSYDANGNLITGDGKFRIYNGFNKLVQVREGDNTTAPILENYTWHPMEDRIFAKSVYQNGSWQETVFYITKSFVRVQNATGAFDYKYIYQNGQLVAQQNPDGTKLFFHNDNLGSVGLITNESGAKVEETFYEPFGKIIAGGESSRYDYTGKEFDSVTGDYDFNARKLSINPPGFITPDQNIQNVYEPKDLNRYSYVRNNPYVAIDPTGKFVVYVGISSSMGAIVGGSVGTGFAISFSLNDGLQFGTYDRVSAGAVSPTINPLSVEAGYSSKQKNLNEFAGKSKDVGLDMGLGSFSVGGGVSVPYDEENDELEWKKYSKSNTIGIIDINPQIIPGSGYYTSSTTSMNLWYGNSNAIRSSINVDKESTQIQTSSGYSYSVPTSLYQRYPNVDWTKKEAGKGLCLSCSSTKKTTTSLKRG